MTIEELLKEASDNKNNWYHYPPENVIMLPYYGGDKNYVMWLKKSIKYLKEHFSSNDDAKRFIEIASIKTSHYTDEFDEMICCLEMLIDEKEELTIVINGQDLIDLNIVNKAPSYITDVLKEANLCYKNSLYNGCAVLLRKATENLIIEAFDKNGRLNEIKDSNGDFLAFKNLIVKLLNASPTLWNISRNTKKSLEEIKKIGDLSAHNIKFSAKKGDIDSIILDYRITLQEINLSIY